MSFFNELKRRNVIRVTVAYVVIGWFLLQVADILTPALHLPDWIASAIALVFILGIIPVLLFSWAYELTPEGIKKDSEVDKSASDTSQTAKKLDVITLVAVAGVIGLVVWQQTNPASSNVAVTEPKNESLDTQKNSLSSPPVNVIKTTLALGVAVLPFSNLSEDPNNAFFAGGVHEDVLTQLSYIKKLRVISRTSMLKIAERGMEVRDIGKHLDVSHVLEGSVRRSGDEVRVTVQLIDAATDEHVWADNFDRKLDDIFAIQSEIAEKIAAQLKAELTPEEVKQIEQIPTNSSEAYDLYLKARELGRVWRGADTFKEMLPLLEKAIELDPNFLKARVMLVEVYGRLVWTGSDPTGEYRIKAKATLDYIQTRHPNSIEAAHALGGYLYTIERDYAGTLKALEKVLLEHSNDTEVLLRVASSHKRLNNFAEGLPLIQKAVSLDPEHASIAGELSLHYLGAGLIEQAYATSKENVVKFPDDVLARLQLASMESSYFGNLDRFIEIMDQLSPLDRYRSAYYDLTISPTNSDKIVKTIDTFKKDRSDFEVANIDLRVAYLLAAVGREQDSQQRARVALQYLDKDDGSLENYIGHRKKGFYADMTFLACLADDQSAFERFEGIMHSHKAAEIGESEINYALAVAECGDIERAWSLLSRLLHTEGLLGTVTPWEMALDPLYRLYFSELPEYQKMVADLKAAKAQR